MSPHPALDEGRRRREAARVLAENARRATALPADFYSPARPANLFLRHGQERALRAALGSTALLPLAGRTILEVGCGHGTWLHRFATFGAHRTDLHGLDLDATRLATARSPSLTLVRGDAAALPWVDGHFDLVLQSTVFTSILDDAVRRAAAAEMRRVVRPGGTLLWYDFRVDNPRNPHVRGISGRALRDLFPGCAVHCRRVTLAPPLARGLVPRSWTLATILEAMGWLNTHLFAVIRPVS